MTHEELLRCKVFVGGLDYALNDVEFGNHFSQYGPIRTAEIVRDPMTKASRGFGFVTY